MDARTKRKRKSVPRTYHRQNTRGRTVLKLIVLVVAVGLFIVFFTGHRSLYTLYSLQQREKKLDFQKQELIQENSHLEEEIDKLKNDKEYMEKIAREKYNMKKPGEDVYLVNPE